MKYEVVVSIGAKSKPEAVAMVRAAMLKAANEADEVASNANRLGVEQLWNDSLNVAMSFRTAANGLRVLPLAEEVKP